MTKVDFYLISETTFESSLYFVCRLLEKVYLQKQQIYVQMNNETEAKLLDDLLWTFREDGFIPHSLLSADHTTTSSPILISSIDAPLLSHNILLNLTQSLVSNYKNFTRVIGIVINETKAKEICRQKFRNYKEEQCELTTHNLAKN